MGTAIEPRGLEKGRHSPMLDQLQVQSPVTHETGSCGHSVGDPASSHFPPPEALSKAKGTMKWEVHPSLLPSPCCEAADAKQLEPEHRQSLVPGSFINHRRSLCAQASREGGPHFRSLRQIPHFEHPLNFLEALPSNLTPSSTNRSKSPE